MRSANTNNTQLLQWVEKVKQLTKPANVHWCDGSDQEYATLCEELVKKGTFVRLNEKFVGKNSFLARTDERDVARHESRMFICTKVEEDIGHGRNWAQQTEMTDRLAKLLAGSMEGRTMYVVPFAMGPPG